MRKEEPTGKEIAQKRKIAKLEQGLAIHAKKYGKVAKFTPADLHHIKNIDELDQGVVLGEFETELDRVDTNLPPGKYTLFLAGLENGWKLYAESNGEIVDKAAKVKVELYPQGSRLSDESHMEFESPWILTAFFGITSIVIGIIGWFR